MDTADNTAWQLAPADLDRLQDWLDCRDQWLDRLERRSGASRTRHAYTADWHAFFGRQNGYRLAPWHVTHTDAEQWLRALAQRLAPATVNRRIAVLTSYYRFASKHTIDGRPLWTGTNPFLDDVLRFNISPFGRACYPTTAEVRGLLAAIDPDRPTGLRDLAIFAGLFMTTRRLTEWLNLRWRDIRVGDDGHWFEYRCKGGLHRRQVLPPSLYGLLVTYLRAAGRWPLPDDACLFASPRQADRPLNPGYIRYLMQRYGAQAGIAPEKCHPHGLRHAGARYRREQGATVWELRDVLGHASIAITEVYVGRVLSDPEDRQADAVGAILPAFRSAIAYSFRDSADPTPTSDHSIARCG